MKSPVYFPTPKAFAPLSPLRLLVISGGISRDSKLIKTQKHIADKRHLGNWFRAALQHARTHPLLLTLFSFYHRDLTLHGEEESR